MSEPFIAEIRMFGFNFAPQDWAFCNGQTLPIQQNTALYSVIGVTYGGDGRTTFMLPNLQGRAPMCAGQVTGLTPRSLGQSGGAANVTLTTAQMPTHTHAVNASTSTTGNLPDPNNAIWAQVSGRNAKAYTATATPAAMNPAALSTTGGSSQHNNLMPYQVLNFCIALVGVFPVRP
jgi:microcystin-dependent protein